MSAQTETAARLREAMRRTISPVGIVTVDTPEGPRGMTLTAFLSLSMAPPSVAFAVNTKARIHPHLKVGARLCLNILGEGDVPSARAFGGEVAVERRFEAGDWRMSAGDLPSLGGAVASLQLEVTSCAAHGSHELCTARVTDVELGPSQTPLLYGHGQYMKLADLTPA